MTPATYLFLLLILVAGASNPVRIPPERSPVVTGVSVPASDFLGQPLPGIAPTRFAAEEVSQGLGERSLVFSPDLTEAYFQHRDEGGGTSIARLMLRDGEWTVAEAPVSSGTSEDNDFGPILSPDGAMLYFYSDRDGSSGGTDFWVAERWGSDWSASRRLTAPINSSARDEDLSIASDGTIYFSSDRDGGYDIFRAPLVDGAYPTVERLGAAVNSEHFDGHPCIAPDQRYLVFTSGGRPDDLGDADLYVSFRQSEGAWSAAVNMGSAINSAAHEASPTLSPDGRYIFFLSERDGESRIYWVDVAFVERLRQLIEPVPRW